MTEPICMTNNPPDYATLVREALDADEQHGNVRGIKYAILAVAQAIRDSSLQAEREQWDVTLADGLAKDAA